MVVSVIIPARNEQHLERTIRDVLANARGEIEVIVLLDGYLPDPPIDIGDQRVTFYPFPESIGQRAAINFGVSKARGEFIMKLDAHCSVDEGFDVKLATDCAADWTVIPRMYNLDVETWKPKLHKRTDYMYIGLRENGELRTEYYTGSEYKRRHAKPDLIDDTMSCMGPGWFLRKDRFLELGGCDENHGGWGQQGIEVACKAWLSGGRLVVNKKTWFAHWFRGGGGPGFPYPLSGRAVAEARKYSKDLWLSDKWPQAKRKFQWMIDKFNPPGWNESAMGKEEQPRLGFKATGGKGPEMLTEKEQKLVDDFHALFFKHWNIFPRTWMGTRIVKYPQDLFLYQMLIHQNKPDVIIESGAFMGGGALFFANMCDCVGHGEVISIDRRELKRPQHPRIHYVIGRSTAVDTLQKVADMCNGKTCMVILDSDHRRVHVKRELLYYHKFVTVGQYLVTEDTMLGSTVNWKYGVNVGPLEAVQWFMGSRYGKKFVNDMLEYHYLTSMNCHSWLRRVG